MCVWGGGGVGDRLESPDVTNSIFVMFFFFFFFFFFLHVLLFLYGLRGGGG